MRLLYIVAVNSIMRLREKLIYSEHALVGLHPVEHKEDGWGIEEF